MATATKEPGMGKKRGRPRRSERDDMAAKIDRKVLGMAKAIAVQKGIPVAELLTDILDGPIRRMYAQMLRDLEG